MPTIVDEPAAHNSLSLRATRHQTAGVRYPHSYWEYFSLGVVTASPHHIAGG